MFLRIIIAALLAIAASPAFAGSATVGYTAGSGTNFAVTTDIGGNFNSRFVLCDFTACANGLSVDATSNAAHVVLYQGTTVLGAANGLPVTPTTGASWAVSGSISNASSAVATSSVNLGTVGYNYVFNGTTWDQLQDDANKNLKIVIFQGASAVSAGNPLFFSPGTGSTWSIVGATSNAGSAVATGSANVQAVTYNYGFNGATWDQLQVDGSKSLKVNCITGCSGGSVSNATSGVSTSSTNLGVVSWNYGFNGTTWDQLQVDASKFLKVNCATGCGGTGTISNATFLAPSSTNTQTVAYIYGFNGTNWVQGLSDGSGFIEVNTAAGGIQGFPPGTLWSGSNGVGIAAGEQHIGEVGSHGGVLTSSALGVTAIAHAAGTCLGTLVTFSNAVRNNAAALTAGTSGILQNIVVGFTSSAAPTNLDAIFFTSNPGTNPCNAADGATYTLNAADVGKALPAVQLTQITASAGSYLMSLGNVAMRYGLISGTTLYGVLVVRQNAVTPAIGTTFNIGVFED